VFFLQHLKNSNKKEFTKERIKRKQETGKPVFLLMGAKK